MLFDLQGKRRRVIQVVYALLAALFLIGFVGFGVGTESGVGGIFDAFSGGDGASSTNPQYEEDIEQAEQQLAQDPKDERALIQLAETHYLAAQDQLETDEETGQPIVTDEARVELDESVTAWEDYLKVAKKPDADTAALVVQAYVLLNDAEGAAETQRIVAEDRPSQNAYGTLALYLYLGGDIQGGDEAAKQAIAGAEGSQKAVVKRQLDQLAEQAVKQKKQLEKQAKNAPQGENPLQQPLGGGGIGAPTAPAPTSP